MDDNQVRQLREINLVRARCCRKTIMTMTKTANSLIATEDSIGDPTNDSPLIIDSAQKAYQLLVKNYNPDAEEVWGVYLTHQLEMIVIVMVHKGTANSCKIHARDIFREAVRANCYTFVLAHNHTSASCEPSLEDIRITQKLKKCAALLEISILDHVIFTKNNYYSFKESGRF